MLAGTAGALELSGKPRSEVESKVGDVQVISELGFVGSRGWGLSGGLGWVGTVESWEQALFSPLGSPEASWRGERGEVC